MHIFLSHYDKIKHTFSRSMEQLTGTALSFDHTFKVSNHVGIVRNDDSFVKQFVGCFLEMNEYGEVTAWRLTKATAFDELKTFCLI